MYGTSFYDLPLHAQAYIADLAKERNVTLEEAYTMFVEEIQPVKDDLGLLELD